MRWSGRTGGGGEARARGEAAGTAELQAMAMGGGWEMGQGVSGDRREKKELRGEQARDRERGSCHPSLPRRGIDWGADSDLIFLIESPRPGSESVVHLDSERASGFRFPSTVRSHFSVPLSGPVGGPPPPPRAPSLLFSPCGVSLRSRTNHYVNRTALFSPSITRYSSIRVYSIVEY